MRILLSSLSISAALFIAGTAVAADAAKPAVNVAKPKPSLPMVTLYAMPEIHAAVVEKVSPAERLVAIFEQGDWIKVGDPRDGKVGWINHKLYQQALNEWYKPNVQSYFIQTVKNTDGKPGVKIIAYSNGKKLSDSEAKAMYAKMQKENERQWQEMHRLNAEMAQVFAHQRQWMNENFDVLSAVDLMPVVVDQSPAEKVSIAQPKAQAVTSTAAVVGQKG